MPEPRAYDHTPESEGWTRRFIACEPRLSEAVKLYRESGFDVLLARLSPEKNKTNCTGANGRDICRECFDGVEEGYRIIYTRPKNHPS